MRYYRRNIVRMSETTHFSPRDRAKRATDRDFPERAAITRAAAGIALYAGAFGVTFGAIAIASGLTVLQALFMSVVAYTGASQFAFVGVLGAGGSPLAGLSAALLLGTRNMFYGVPVTQVVQPRGLQRLWTAHFVIDETTAMAVAQRDSRAGRYAFFATGISLFSLWTVGTLAGALIGSGINTAAFGLSAAAPAIFLALLWPQLSRHGATTVAIASALVTLALIPIAPAGVPILAAAVVAVVVGASPTKSTGDEEAV